MTLAGEIPIVPYYLRGSAHYFIWDPLPFDKRRMTEHVTELLIEISLYDGLVSVDIEFKSRFRATSGSRE